MWLTDGELGAWLRTSTQGVDVGNTAAITAANLAAHAAITSPIGGCGRDFNTAATDATDRIIEASNLVDCGRVLRIPDCTEITAVIGSATVDTADFRALRAEPDGMGEVWPYDRIMHRSVWSGDSTWGYFTVTAKWGWPATPYRVIEATKVLAKDCLEQRDVRLGLAGITEVAGVRIRENLFVAAVVQSYRSIATWGIA